MLCMLTEEQKKMIYSQAYHSKYEDNLPWKFVTGVVNMNLGTNYTAKEVQKVCEKIYKNNQIVEWKSWKKLHIKVFFFFSCLAFTQKNVIIKSRKTNKSNENPTDCTQWGFLVLFITRSLTKTQWVLKLTQLATEQVPAQRKKQTSQTPPFGRHENCNLKIKPWKDLFSPSPDFKWISVNLDFEK